MEGTFPDPHGGGQRGKPVGVCNRHLCMSFSHVDHRPQGTDAPSSGEAGSGRGAAVALGLCLGWGAAPRYLHGPHDQAAAPPQPTLAPARGGGQFTPFGKAGQLLGFLAMAGAGWGSAGASPAGRWLGGGVRAEAADSPGMRPRLAEPVLRPSASTHLPRPSVEGGTVPSPGVAAPDPSCPWATARASDPRAPSALSARVQLPGH